MTSRRAEGSAEVSDCGKAKVKWTVGDEKVFRFHDDYDDRSDDKFGRGSCARRRLVALSEGSSSVSVALTRYDVTSSRRVTLECTAQLVAFRPLQVGFEN